MPLHWAIRRITNTNVMQGLQAVASGAATAAKYNNGQPTPTDPNALAGSSKSVSNWGQDLTAPGQPLATPSNQSSLGPYQPSPWQPLSQPGSENSSLGTMGSGGGFFGTGGGAPNQNRIPYQPAPGKSVFDLSEPTNNPQVQYPQY